MAAKLGECVYKNELQTNTNEIDISSLAKGIYVVLFTRNNFTAQQKFIKE